MPVGMEHGSISFSDIALQACPEHAATIGRILTTWSLIEASTATLLGLMMHHDHRAALALLGNFRSNNSRIGAVKKVGREVLDPLVFEEFNKVMTDVLDYAEERNAIAHGIWGVDENRPGIVFRMPMENFSRFMIETAHGAPGEILIKLEALKITFSTFTLDQLNQIEKKGQGVLKRIMNETTKGIYSRALENQAKAK